MLVSAIVAISNNRVIGKDNELPWYLPNDLKYFKKQTIGKPVIMGRKTFVSIGKPLPKRLNIVLTRDSFFIATGCLMAAEIEEALELALDSGAEECFIIGGGTIYEQVLPICDFVYITEVDIDVADGDVFFPTLNEEEWILSSEENCSKDAKNEYDHSFKIYARK